MTEVVPPKAQRFILAAGWWFVAALTIGACTLLLNEEAKQCQDDRDCVRFPNAVCNPAAGICIARPSFPMSVGGTAGTPGTAGTVGPGGSAGAGGTTAAPPADAGPAVADGGRPAGPGGQAGALTGPGGAAGAGGAAASECPDLDDNRVADCQESLVINPNFKLGIEGWIPESDMRQYFQFADGAGNAASGALAVINGSRSDSPAGSTSGGSKQCVSAPGPNTYELYLQTLIAPPADGGVSSAGATLQFYSAADCAGQPSGAFMPSQVDASTAGWRVMHGVVATPAGTRSMLVRLVVVKPLKQPPTEGWFDNVLLKIRR